MKNIGLLVTPKVDENLKTISMHIDQMDIPQDADTLSMMYKHLGCDIVEVIRSKMGNIWVDEEGFFKAG